MGIMLFTLLLTWLAIPATGTQVNEGTSTSVVPSNIGGEECGNDGNAIDIFAWAKEHGAKIADERIEIRNTPYGGRGLFAKRRIPANTEVVLIPYHLQLGVRQLAEGGDEEMQKMARSLPWEYIRENELFFIPLSVALVAERRKGAESLFWPFLQSITQHCANSVAAVKEGRIDDDLSALHHWAPHLATKVEQRRLGVQTIHKTLSPSSVSINDLQWAAMNVCSRSLLRKRMKELTPEQIKRVGGFSASDHSRMLPVIDMVNHGSLEQSNVWVGHLSREGDEFSTSLVSTRDIEDGEELLFDYGGGGEKISNDRLLLDYGFVLTDHTDRVYISLEEFSSAVAEFLGGDRIGMKDVKGADSERLAGLIKSLIKSASEVEAGALLHFTAGGEPAVQTHAIAIAMTCRNQDDVTCLLELLDRMQTQNFDASLLASQIVEGCTDLQREYARYALKRAAGLALVSRQAVKDCNDDSENQFAAVAREYSTMCEEMLKRIADLST